MRFLNRDIVTVELLRPEKVPSGYIGTKADYSVLYKIMGQISIASDTLSIQQYGQKAETMYTLNVDYRTDIRKGDRVRYDGREYSVTGVREYTDHKTAVLEISAPLKA